MIMQFEVQKYYEGSLKYYRDAKNERDTAKDEGIEEGIEIGKELGKEERDIEIAKNALAMGLSLDDVIKLTGLSKQQITNI